MAEKLIPFILKGDPCAWHDGKGNVYKLGDPDLQKKGLPEDIFERIEKSKLITAVEKPKEKEKIKEK